MRLEMSNIPHYLMARKVLDPAVLARGDLRVLESSFRNRNFQVVCGRSEEGYFLKQPRSFEAGRVDTLKRESECYRLVNMVGRYSSLAHLMPSLVDYDSSRNVLILQRIPNAKSFREYYKQCKSYPSFMGSMLGAALGHLHSQTGKALAESMLERVNNRKLPWVLFLAQRNVSKAPGLSKANKRLVEILQAVPTFAMHLKQLRKEWRKDSLIHGDIKWDNVLLYKKEGKKCLCVIDWEMANLGDRCWDLGGVFQAFLTSWIRITSSNTPGSSSIQITNQLLEAMQENILAFWTAYLDMRKPSREERQELLCRALRFSGARLIQSAYELCQNAYELSHQGRMMLQLSINILEEPDRAASELFGLQEVS